jgi:hypothetical protein
MVHGREKKFRISVFLLRALMKLKHLSLEGFLGGIEVLSGYIPYS